MDSPIHAPVGAAQVREQLDRILADASFASATRRSRLLRFLVEQTLENPNESLKESVIAVSVFDRAPDYDPQVDSVVRVEVGRLRSRLAEYYEKTGPDDPVRIEIPKGGYRPVFIFRDIAPERTQGPAVSEHRARWPWIAAGAAAVLILGSFIAWRVLRPAPATITSIAVLPFLNLSGNAADEYLGDGISEELTQNLAEFGDLRVVARTSAFQYKGKSVDVRDVGNNLRAGAVLEGSFSRRDGQLRVIAQLIRTSDGFHLWAHTYDSSIAGLAGVESDIARATREMLTPSSGAGKGEAFSTRNPEAHDFYMRAVYEANQRTEASLRRAIELAQQAADKDPSFAQPYVVMAAAESQLTTLQARSAREGAELGWKYIGKALALDPRNRGAHAQKALLAYTDQWDWPQAEREFGLALAGGVHGSAENLYGWCLITRGRFEEAGRRLQVAAELDPLSLGPQLNQVELHIQERNYAAAKQKLDQILKISPGSPVGLVLATSVGYWQQDCEGTTLQSRKLLELYPQAPGARLNALSAEFVCGHPAEAKAAARALLADSGGYLSPYAKSAVFAIGGDADGAMRYLDESAKMHEPSLLMLRVDHVFDSIRKDARVMSLEKKLGLLD